MQSVKGNGNINPKIRVKKIFPSLIGDKAFAKYIFTGTKGGAGIGSFALHLLSFAYYEAGLSITASMWVLLVKGDFLKMIFENESLNLDR